MVEVKLELDTLQTVTMSKFYSQFSFLFIFVGCSTEIEKVSRDRPRTQFLFCLTSSNFSGFPYCFKFFKIHLQTVIHANLI